MSMKIALLALKTPSSKLLSLNGYRFGKICFDASFKCMAKERGTFTLNMSFLFTRKLHHRRPRLYMKILCNLNFYAHN